MPVLLSPAVMVGAWPPGRQFSQFGCQMPNGRRRRRQKCTSAIAAASQLSGPSGRVHACVDVGLFVKLRNYQVYITKQVGPLLYPYYHRYYSTLLILLVLGAVHVLAPRLAVCTPTRIRTPHCASPIYISRPQNPQNTYCNHRAATCLKPDPTKA